MFDESDTYNTEKEFQRKIVEAVANRVEQFTQQIEELDRHKSENNYVSLDPEEAAEMFGRSDITIREYFYGEISNLRAGLKVITDKGVQGEIFSRISALLIKIDKVFKPEEFVFEYLSIVDALMTTVDHTTHVPGQKKYITVSLSQVEKMVSILNSTIRTRQLVIDEDNQKQIDSVNELLKAHNIPKIITTQY